jgi:GntR family transcriptional repressor for pyruvate dehydrogenase complex
MPAFTNDSSAEISSALGSLPTGSAVSAVATRLLDYFTSGAVEPGTRLPPERQLASSLAVGRSAVREALAAAGFRQGYRGWLLRAEPAGARTADV